jgi:hypothetical protein
MSARFSRWIFLCCHIRRLFPDIKTGEISTDLPEFVAENNVKAVLNVLLQIMVHSVDYFHKKLGTNSRYG